MDSFYGRVERALHGDRKMCDQGGFFARGYSTCKLSPYHGEVITLCKGEVGLFVVIPDGRECVRLVGFKLAGYVDGDSEIFRFRREIRQKLTDAGIPVDETGGAA